MLDLKLRTIFLVFYKGGHITHYMLDFKLHVGYDENEVSHSHVVPRARVQRTNSTDA
jgi:hypothetical protein